MVRALPAKSFLTVFLSAILLVDAASLANPKMAWNTGGLAIIGIFTSKTLRHDASFIDSSGVWVLLDHGQRRLMRPLAFIGVVGGAALSVGAVVAVCCALACSLLAFNLRYFPPRSRVVILCAGGLLIVILCSFLIVFGDELFQAGLQLTGKGPNVSNRAELWDV